MMYIYDKSTTIYIDVEETGNRVHNFMSHLHLRYDNKFDSLSKLKLKAWVARTKRIINLRRRSEKSQD